VISELYFSAQCRSYYDSVLVVVVVVVVVILLLLLLSFYTVDGDASFHIFRNLYLIGPVKLYSRHIHRPKLCSW
jgi:hypothetical protein